MASPKVIQRHGRKHYSTFIEGKYVSTGETDQRVALQKAAQMKVVGIDAYKEGKRMLSESLSEQIEEHLNYLVEDGRAEGHISKKRMQLMKPVNDGAFSKLKDVKKQTFEPWWKKLTCGPKTRNSYLTAWNVFLDWLKYEGKLLENPLRGRIRRARETKESKIVRRAFTMNEIGRLLLVADHHELVYLVAIVTGARKNELKQLRWNDVHELDQYPHIVLRSETTKNGKGRKQYLTREAIDMLANTRKLSTLERVFRYMPGHHILDKHLKLAKIPKKTEEGVACFHSFRHTFTTIVARMTCDTRLAQRMADHADITTTQGYMHTEQSEHAAAMRNFPSVRKTSRRATGRATTVVQTGQNVSHRVPSESNKNTTQVSLHGRLSPSLTNIVKEGQTMEPGRIELPCRNSQQHTST